LTGIIEVIVTIVVVAELCFGLALAANVGGTARWVASRDLSRTVWRRNNSQRAWQLTGWFVLAVGLFTGFVLLAELAPKH
jgi:hypothetical protein